MAGLDRAIQGQGSSEAAWAESPWLRSLPDAGFLDLLQESTRLVVLSPHPDDETLGCGGLIFDAQQKKLGVLVCSVTSGENCYPDHETRLMGQRRHGELLLAMSRLGLSESAVIAWSLPDGGLAKCRTELRARLLATVVKTDLLLAPWELDGHPDHETCGEIAAAVAEERRARLLRYPVWGWHWSSTVDHLRGLPSAHGMRYALDSAAMTAKHSAMEAFTSQIDPAIAGASAVLSPTTLSRFQRDFEVYLT